MNGRWKFLYCDCFLRARLVLAEDHKGAVKLLRGHKSHTQPQQTFHQRNLKKNLTKVNSTANKILGGSTDAWNSQRFQAATPEASLERQCSDHFSQNLMKFYDQSKSAKTAVQMIQSCLISLGIRWCIEYAKFISYDQRNTVRYLLMTPIIQCHVPDCFPALGDIPCKTVGRMVNNNKIVIIEFLTAIKRAIFESVWFHQKSKLYFFEKL